MTKVAEGIAAGSTYAIRDHLDLAATVFAMLAFFAIASIVVSYALWFCIP